MKQVELGDLDPKLGELFGEAERGEEVVFTRQGRPVARLVVFTPPYDRERARRAVEKLRGLGDEFAAQGASMTQDEIRALREEGWG